jgi:glucosamine--fructose-6-phosphate aminotransferase (isomerizing)
MCGIVGYIGERDAVSVLIESLKKLEYRGYDSAGLALLDDKGKCCVFKTAGEISQLESILPELPARIGIGHTRWATHGKPNTINAHPHVSGSISVVHNGIIENYLELKESLESEGFVFVSDTDTEVLAHLINKYYSENPGDLAIAVRSTLGEVRGSYALAVLSEEHPHELMTILLHQIYPLS